MKICLTFDLEDWFHILDQEPYGNVELWNNFESRIFENTDYILKELEKRKIIATFFCLGWVAEKYPQLIKRIYDEKHEIASHSYHHRLVYKMTRAEFALDALRSKNVLEELIGQAVYGYRAPGFSVNASVPWFFDELVSCGYKYDSSIFLHRRNHGGWRSFLDNSVTSTSGIVELPLRPARFMGVPYFWSGGGYFRISPRKLLKMLQHNTQDTMFYLHPRDIDPSQPIMKLRFPRNIKHYIGLRNAKQKFEYFLDTFSFETAKDRYVHNL